MTTYNQILDSDIEIGKSATSQLMTKLRDNPIAIAEGNSSLIKIQEEAISREGVTAGDNIIFVDRGQNNPYLSNQQSGVIKSSFKIQVAGTYRLEVVLKSNPFSGTLQWKKGSTVIAGVEKLSNPNVSDGITLHDSTDYSLVIGDVIDLFYITDFQFFDPLYEPMLASIAVSNASALLRCTPIAEQLGSY